MPTRILQKVETGIHSFDLLAQGGLPEGRTTLVAGTAGSGKTVFAVQFLAEGIRQFGQKGVFVTFEESPDDIRKNMAAFEWDISGWEAKGLWSFVDGSPQPGEPPIEIGQYDLGGLMVRVAHAIRTTSATRVVLDSLGAVFSQFADASIVRTELFNIAQKLKEIGVTTVMTVERDHDHGQVSRYCVEEFVADNVVLLRNALDEERRRRTIEVLKFRGTPHQTGEWPFSVVPGQGLVGLPLSAVEMKQSSSQSRVTSGVKELDDMCDGGFYADSLTLVAGPTGTGKTLLATEFVAGAAKRGGRALYVSFEESREQLIRNAMGWGIDFQRMVDDDHLRIISSFPETDDLQDHLIRIKCVIDEFKPTRVVIDSLSAINRIATTKGFQEFIIGLCSFFNDHSIVGVVTSTTPSLMGGHTITESHVSTMYDSIILLQYVEIYGEVRRGLTVIKMRGSAHEKNVREFMIDSEGMHIGKPFRNVTGILTGEPHVVSADIIERIGSMFQDEGRAARSGRVPRKPKTTPR